MQRYVSSENVRRFKAMLAGPLDPEQRRRVETLLRREEAILARLDRDADDPRPAED